VVGTKIVPPVLIVNVQLGVDTDQEILMEVDVEFSDVTLIVGTAGLVMVIGNS
jgi:hypothetical protein